MKNNRPLPEPTPAPDAPPAPRTGLLQSWSAFWFTPANPVGLHALRVLFGLLVLAWLLSFWGRQEAFFGLGGWFDRQAYREHTEKAADEGGNQHEAPFRRAGFGKSIDQL